MFETNFFLLKYDDEKEYMYYSKFIFSQSLPKINYSNQNFFHLYNSSVFKYKFLLNSSDNPILKKVDNFNFETFDDLIKNSSENSFSDPQIADSFLNKYLNKKKFSFTNFFIDNLIDVPICFKKSKSVKRKIFTFPILKFSNYFLKKGKKEKINKTLLLALAKVVKILNKSHLRLESYLSSWLHFYLVFNETLYFNGYLVKTGRSFNFDTEVEPLPLSFSEEITTNESANTKIKKEKFDIELPNLNRFTNSGKKINLDFFYKNTLETLFFKINPIFSFFIYSVDKNIRKFSRGKSGKYVFLWKYIAPHKRHYLIMKWIAKDCKFYQDKKFVDRLTQAFINVLINDDKSFVHKSKIFSHNYVFKNFKKTLFANFKTTS